MLALNPSTWTVRLSAAVFPYALMGLAAVTVGAAGGWHFTDQAWQARFDREALARAEAAALDTSAANDARQADRETTDAAAGEHAAALAQLNKQLGGAYAQIALLSHRKCLDADTVSMLNGIDTAPTTDNVRAIASQSAGTATTSPQIENDSPQFSSERDVAEAIATCRMRYLELSSQLNMILDIETIRNSDSLVLR